MPQNKQKPSSSGFRKGFLLESSTKKSKKKASKPKRAEPKKAVSSALLDVEQDHQSNQSPLLIVSENDSTPNKIPESPTKKPLPVLLGEEDGNDDALDDDCFGLTAVSTKRKSPLILSMPSDDDDNVLIREQTHHTPANESENEKPLLWEVPSTKPSMIVTNDDDGSHNDDNTPSSCEPIPALVQERLEPNAMLAHELPNLLWKLKQGCSTEQQEQATVQKFVASNVQSAADWKVAWQFILKMIAEDSSRHSTAPSIRLGIMLLQIKEGLKAFIPFLEPGTDKHSRVLALSGAVLISRFCENRRETKISVSNKAWLTSVLPMLSKIVLSSAGPTKRSVLMQQSISAAFDIVAMASGQEDGIALLDLKSTLWDAISIVDSLLRVQQGWIESSLLSSPSELSTATTSSPDASRKKCTLAVLNDWRMIVKEGLRLYEAIQIEGEEHNDDALGRLAQYTCLQLSGDASDGFGGLHQTLSNDPPRVSADEIVACLQRGVQLLQSVREQKESEEVASWQRERMRAILRGVASWLGRSKKHLQALAKPSAETDGTDSGNTYLQQSADLSIHLLRCDTDASANLVLSILGYLWSPSNGLPPDVVADNDSSPGNAVPESFEALLSELKIGSTDDTDVLEPADRALCVLVARCIVYQGSSLLNELVERNGLSSSSTVEILSDIMSETGQAEARENSLDCGAGDKSLSMLVGEAFLGCVETSHYAQRKLVACPGLLCNLPAAATVPKLIATGNAHVSDSGIITAVSAAVQQILVSSLPNETIDVIVVILESLRGCDENEQDLTSGDNKEHTGNGSKIDTPRSTILCRKLTGGWRRTLLESPTCGVNGLACVLSAVASAMFADPSSSIPLALLGSIVGDELSLTASDKDQASRVHAAVIALIRQSLAELGKARDVNTTAEEAHSIYSRLSPLLLLRRIPCTYYKVAWRALMNNRAETVRLFSLLMDQLSDRLGTSTASQKHVAYTAQERQLAAEIVGRDLPFYESTFPSCSSYKRIIYPSFSSALRTLKIVPDDSDPRSPKESLRTARAALYACCNHVPFAEDSEAGQGVFGVVSFVLAALNVDMAKATQDEVVTEDDIVQLQTGGIEFIAACLESTLQRHVRKQQKNSSEAVVEVDERLTSSDANGSKPAETSESTANALVTSSSAIASSLRTGAPIPYKLRLLTNGFVSDTSAGVQKQEFSVSARTCLWNAFLVVSQRCPDDGRLTSWANLTANWVLEWASLAPVDDNLRHPLCMAAALEVIFVLVTRTKSFDCLAGGKSTASSVRKAHTLAIVSIKTETNVGGNYARATMRKSALKLLLALVSIDQFDGFDSLPNSLGPGELGETFTLLNGTANMDTDPEVRALATHILTGMRAA